MLRPLEELRAHHLIPLALILALVLCASLSSPAFAAEDPVSGSGSVVVRGRLMDNDGDPVAGQKVTFTLKNATEERFVGDSWAFTNALGYYELGPYYIETYMSTHDICLSTSHADPVRFAAQDGVLIYDFTIVNHGTINITVMDGSTSSPVGAGVPFWATTVERDAVYPGWPAGYHLGGQLERTTNSSGVISIFTDGGFLYQYDQTGDKRYTWLDHINLTPTPGGTKDVTIWVTPLGKVDFTALTPGGAAAAGFRFTLPAGKRFVEDPGDGTVSFYAPAGSVNISGKIAGNPLTGDMGYKLQSTPVTVTAWGTTSGSGTIQPHAPGTISGTIYWLPGYDLVEGATVQVYWRPNPESALTLLHEATTDARGEFSISGVVPNDLSLPSDAPYTVRASKAAVQGTASYPWEIWIRPGGGENIDLYMVGDTTPPAVPSGLSVTDPGDGSGLALVWTANSDSDLASYSVYRSTAVDGEYARISEGMATNAYKDTTAAVGRTYWYSATAVDRAGNESGRSTASPGTLTEPPATSISLPLDSSYVDDAAGLSGTAAKAPGAWAPEIARVELLISRPDHKYWSGSEWTDAATWLPAFGTETWNYSLSGAGLLTGEVEYTADARAVDSSGLADPSPATVAFTFDKNAPEVQFDTPAAGANLTTDQPPVTATAIDSCSGVARVSFKYSSDGTTWTDISSDATGADGYTVTWGSVRLPGGQVTLRATATDTVGRTASCDLSVTVNATPNVQPYEPDDEPEYEEPAPVVTPPKDPDTISGSSSPETGVTITSGAGNMTLSIPAGATDTAVEFTVAALTPKETSSLLETAALPQGFTSVGPVIEFSAAAVDGSEPVTSFEEPLVFEIVLSEDDLARISAPQKIGLFRVNDDGSLTFVGGRLVGDRLVVSMNHFSRYVIGETLTTFDDIRGHCAQADIELMAARWVVLGRPSGLFDPEATVTRAEFTLMLGRAMLLRPSDSDPGFTDVRASDFFYAELAAAVNRGLVSGYGDSTFRPDAGITREEMAVMVARALRSQGSVAEGSDSPPAIAGYSDADMVSMWALADVSAVVEAGILRGTNDGMLAPGANATRAEAVAMVARFWDR